ncbi:Ig-like domain-containing protein [Curtobacterium sp. PhB115]|uniref:Ig-like domain-containing protein n=1 Tax=Curtobacterium sp. PhB115 TaxID=2485173 RepID=UPI0011CD6016|nr:Ig-like domain-containing protein [Curtobacterium sp. PhB115]
MSTRGVNVDERAVGGDGPVRRPRSAVLAAVAVALAAGLLTTIAAPAAAATGAAPTALAATSVTPPPAESIAPPTSGRPGAPTPTPSNQPVTAPTIADPGDVTSSTARFHGTGTARHVVRVTGPASTGSAGCTAVVQPNGTWSCLGTVRSGPQQVFSVRDTTTPSLPAASAPASDVIVPPSIASGGTTSGTVAGSGFRGSTVVLSVSGSAAQQTARVGLDGRWVATLPARADGPVTVTASQTASTADGYRSDLRSASSAPVTVTVDRTAPAAPRITSPGAGERVRAGAVVARGTGEPGAGVTVYVDRAPVCRAEVGTSGAWSCSSAGSTLRTGPHELTATQHDAAGNYSKSSTGVRVLVATSGSGTTGQPGDTGTTGATGSPAPGTPGDDGTVDGSTSGTDDPTHTGTAAAGGGGGTGTDGPGSSTEPDGGTTDGSSGTPAAVAGGHGDWSGPAGDWTAATAYDGTVPTIQTAFSWRTVLVATAVAAGFLVLIAAPLALVAAVARGRIRSPFAGLLGRNRARTDRTTNDDVLPSWVSIGLAVTVATLCTLLGVGVALEARYVRLAIAVLLGTAVLTAAVVFATRWAAGSDHRTVGFRVSPWLVLAALVACGITRAADLSPALIVGVVLVPSGRPDLGTGPLRLGSGIAAGARSATWRTIGLLGLAAVGWVVHSLTTGDGFWTSLVSEFAITLCLGGVGAAVASLLPLAGSAGSAVLAASRGRYVALAVVAVALTAAVYSGSTGTHASPVLLGAVAGGCVAAAAGVWIWARTTRRDAPA